MRSFINHCEEGGEKSLSEMARSHGEEMEYTIIAAFEKRSKSGTSIPISVGNRIRDTLEKRYRVKGQASSLGQSNVEVTKEWAKHWEPESVPSSTKTPKTDILIGKNRVSVKMGASQLMGGGVNESLATFYTAAEKIRGAKRKMLGEIETQISNLAPSSVAKGQLAGEIKRGKDKVVMAANSAHKVLQQLMRDTFESNPAFANYFVHEAMTGDVKFGSRSLARADKILSVNHDGTDVHWHDTENSGFLSKIASQAKVTVRFKTTSVKTKAGKTGEYRYWSVVSLIVDKMNEEFDALEKELPYLSEGRIGDFVTNIYDRIKEFIGTIWSKIRDFISQGIKYILEFLGLEPEITWTDVVEFH
jgi:nitrate reductase NapAB chaperone NapD